MNNDIRGFTSIEEIASTAGSVIAVMLITQFTKPILYEWLGERLNVRLYVLLLSLISQIVAVLFLNPTPEGFVLGIVNTFIVATASMGTYETTFNEHNNETPEE